MSMTIEDRIGRKWNDWPNMPVVGVLEFDTSDPMAVWNFTYLYGRAAAAGQMRQVRRENLPNEVRQPLKAFDMDYFLQQVYIDFADISAGQGQNEDARNLRVFIAPKKGYDFETQQTTFTSPAWIIEIGCDHDMKSEQKGRCYYRMTCQTCGYWYEVDSSD